MLTLAMPWIIICSRGLYNACRQIFQLTQNNKIHWSSIAGHLSAIQTAVFPYCIYQLWMKLALQTLLGFLMALTSVAVKLLLDILTFLKFGWNEMGSVDGIWFTLIHWRATSSGTLQVKITVSPGRAACCTLEVRVTWAIECWKYSCMYETENYSNEHRIYNYNLAHNFWLIFS